jgi:hypothetical protein
MVNVRNFDRYKNLSVGPVTIEICMGVRVGGKIVPVLN